MFQHGSLLPRHHVIATVHCFRRSRNLDRASVDDSAPATGCKRAVPPLLVACLSHLSHTYTKQCMLARSSLARLTISRHPNSRYRMPQLTLGSNLALSTEAPTPSPTKTASHARTTSTSTPFKYGEMAGTLAADLKKLGVDKGQANTSDKGGTVAGGEDRTAAHGEPTTAPKHQPEDEIKTENIDEKTKREASKGGRRHNPAKAKTTATAPTHEDVEMDDPDHAKAAGGAQGEADADGTPGNASAQHKAKKAKGGETGGEVETGKDVSGATGPRGKKRAPSEDEGGVAGERGKEGGAKKTKEVYYVRESRSALQATRG